MNNEEVMWRFAMAKCEYQKSFFLHATIPPFPASNGWNVPKEVMMIDQRAVHGTD
ncbi:MAG: hypothetical protein J6K73_04430 [Clostridia bacterium]|nr:hypothetical protein [Clostridia bacterium]